MLPLLLSPEIFPSCGLEGEFCCVVNEVTNNVKEGEGGASLSEERLADFGTFNNIITSIFTF
jgi:hypothetical protein